MYNFSKKIFIEKYKQTFNRTRNIKNIAIYDMKT